MKNRWKIALCVLSMACLLGACADKTEENAQATQTESTEEVSEKEKQQNAEELSIQTKLDMISPAAYGNAKGLELEPGSYISVLGKGASGEYWEEVKKGVAQAEKDLNAELGYEGSDKVKVTFSGPEVKDDVDEQVNILDEELARYPVALAVSIADVQACEVQFDLAKESGIPIVAFDSGSEYKGLEATVTTNNEKAAKFTADKLGELMDGSGKMLVFVHDSKSMAAQDRENAFLKEMKKEYPEIEIAEVIHADDTEEIRTLLADEKNVEAGTEGTEEAITADDITNEEVVDYILEQHSDVTGCFATNGDAMKLAVDGIDRKEMKNVSIIGFDANDYEIEALKEGKIDGLLIQNPFGMGYASVIAAARAALELGNEAFVDTGYTWVTQENIETAEVQSVLYF
ncbi:MAG: substrate-binding domain-containing protein [Dorea sp.]